MIQDNNIMDAGIGGGYSASFLDSDQAANELVSLQREQLNVLQQINVKTTGFSGKGDPLIEADYSIGSLSGPEESLIRNVRTKAEDAGRGFMAKFLSTPTLNTPEMQQSAAMETGQGIFRGITSTSGRLLGAGISIAGNFLPGGQIWGPLLGAGVSAFYANGAKQAEIKSVYDQYFLNYSPGFIDFTESNNTRTGTGLTATESMRLGRSIYSMAPSLRLSQDQLQSLTMQFSESGMLRDSSNIQDTSNKIRELSRQAKEISTLLNTTVESAAEFMSQMNKIGLVSGDYSNVAASIKLSSGLYGVSSETMSSVTANNLATLISGTGISGASAAQSVSLNTLTGGMMYSNYGKADVSSMTFDQRTAYNYMNNIGRENVGAELSSIQSQILNSSYVSPFIASMYTYNPETGQMEYAPGTDISGMNLNQIGRMGSTNLSSAGQQNPSAVTQFMDTSGQRVMNDLNSVQQISLIRDIVNGMIEQSGGQLTATQVLTSTFGLSQQQASLYSNYLNISDRDFYALNSLSSVEASSASIRGDNYGGVKGLFQAGWEGIKQGAGRPFTYVSDLWGVASDTLNRWADNALYGSYVTSSEMVTQTDFYNQTSSGKLDQIAGFQQAASNAYDSYQKLDESSKAFINKIMTGDEATAIEESDLNAFSENAGVTEAGFLTRESFNRTAGRGYSVKDAEAIQAYARVLAGEGEGVDSFFDLMNTGKYGFTGEEYSRIKEMRSRFGSNEEFDEYVRNADESGALDTLSQINQSFAEQAAVMEDTYQKMETTNAMLFQQKELNGDFNLAKGIALFGGGFLAGNLIYGKASETAQSMMNEIGGKSYVELKKMVESGEDQYVRYDENGNIEKIGKSAFDHIAEFFGAEDQFTKVSAEELAAEYTAQAGEIAEERNAELTNTMMETWTSYQNATAEGKESDEFTKNQSFQIFKSLMESGATDEESGVLVSDLADTSKSAEDLGFGSEDDRQKALQRAVAQSTTLSENIGDIMTEAAAQQAVENPLLGKVSKDVAASREYLRVIADEVSGGTSHNDTVEAADSAYDVGVANAMLTSTN